MLSWQNAKALIDEARRLKYRGTQFEMGVVSRLEATRPQKLSCFEEKTIVRMYRRAAGGEVLGLRDNLTEREY